MDSFGNRLNAFKAIDEERGQLLQELCERTETLQLQNEGLKSEIAALKTAAAHHHESDELQQCQAMLQETRSQLSSAFQSMETCPFALVLIDGNAHMFHERFLKGADGGADAACYLRDEIESHLLRYNLDCKIIVHVYLDLQGLIEDCGGRHNPKVEQRLIRFIGGFTQVQPLYNIVDTGPGEEEALVKIQVTLEVFLNNVQCKHVFCGCALNAASLSFLEPYKNDPIIASSITLIKSRPLKDPNIYIAFETIELPSVFRSSDVSEDGDDRDNSSAINRWEHFTSYLSGKAPRRSPIRRSHVSEASRSSSTWDASAKVVLLNVNNDRVDSKLGKIESKAMDSFMERHKKNKLCHYHYLSGSCHTHNCTYTHHIQLSGEDTNILRYITRRLACAQLSGCRKADCMYGHLCPYESGGFCHKGETCHFKAVHGVDRAAVKVWTPNDPHSIMSDWRNTSHIIQDEDVKPETYTPSTPAGTPPPRSLASSMTWTRQNSGVEDVKGKASMRDSSVSAFEGRSEEELIEDKQGELVGDLPYKRFFVKK